MLACSCIDTYSIRNTEPSKTGNTTLLQQEIHIQHSEILMGADHDDALQKNELTLS